jgi:hypothetical protein
MAETVHLKFWLDRELAHARGEATGTLGRVEKQARAEGHLSDVGRAEVGHDATSLTSSKGSPWR